MLDIRFFSSIIYILYEGEALSPPVVTQVLGGAKVSHPHSRRKNGEEDCEEGGQEEGCEEAVITLPLGGDL